MQGLSLPIQVPPQAEPLDRAVRSFESRLRTAGPAGNPRHEELRKAAEEFESLFVAYLFKVMRETLEEASSEETAGFGKAIYTELFDQEISRSVAGRGALGIADMIMRGFREDGAASPDPEHPAPEGAPSHSDRPVDIPGTMLPVRSPVSSDFGFRRDPFTREIRFHKGLDLAAPKGTAVQTVTEGEVGFAGYKPGYGNLVVVRHPGGLETRYAHLGTISVRTGDRLRAQQSVGEVGCSGRSTAPHLHFEVVRWGVNVDPRKALAEFRPGCSNPSIEPKISGGEGE